MDDLISREALLVAIKGVEVAWDIDGNYATYDDSTIVDIIKAQPSVTDTNVGNKWILCNERLPKPEDKYGWVECNVTVMRSHWPTSSYDSCDSPYDEYIVAGAMYDTSQKIWHLGEHTQLNALIDIEDSPLNGDCVIAWTPLPEPYKGD